MAAGLSATALNLAADAVGDAIDHVRAHSGDPGAAGTSNTTTAAVEACAFDPAVAGDIALSAAVNFTGGAASGACSWVSFWDGIPGSGGVWMGNYQLTGDQTFNAAGEYTLDSGIIDFD